MSADRPFIRDLPAGGWVIVAPGRRNRSNAFGVVDPLRPDTCPFCPGHESETPPEISRRSSGAHWTIRVVPNKYPAVDSGHEVIIETPEHELGFDSFESASAAEVVEVYIDRYEAYRQAAQVLIFKNEGARSGASIPHPHSQLIALQRRTPRLQSEASAGACRICAEIRSRERLVFTTESFAVVAPYASRFPYQLEIAPLAHRPDFTAHRLQSAELARLMQHCVQAIRLGAGAPAYNWVFMNAAPPFHWYLEITPRLTVPGGFETGSGAWINIVPPESAAEELRPFFRE